MDEIRSWVTSCTLHEIGTIKSLGLSAWEALSRVVHLSGMGENARPTAWHFMQGRYCFVWTSPQGVAELSLVSRHRGEPDIYWQVTRHTGTPILGVKVDEKDPWFRHLLIIVREVAKERACPKTTPELPTSSSE